MQIFFLSCIDKILAILWFFFNGQKGRGNAFFIYKTFKNTMNISCSIINYWTLVIIIR